MIVACLCWYDERTSMLRECVGSLAGVADALVALDGPFALFPDASRKPRSSKAQVDAVSKASARVGIPATIEQGDEPFPTQLEKRTRLMQMGAKAAESVDDWLLVIDADEHVVFVHPDLRKHLDAVPADQKVAMIGGDDGCVMRRLFRAHKTIRVELSHNGYRVGDEWLAGNSATSELAPVADLSGSLRITHDRRLRAAERNRRANVYRVSRRDAGER